MQIRELAARIFVLALGSIGGCFAAVGDLDPSYGSGGLAPLAADPASAMLIGVLGDGSLIYSAPSSQANAKAYLHSDLNGRPDAASQVGPRLLPDLFAPNQLSQRNATARTADGGLLVGGTFHSAALGITTGDDSAVVRFDAAGQVLHSYGQAGVAHLASANQSIASAVPEALALQPDGHVGVVTVGYAGYFGDSMVDGFVERLNDDGSQDLGFGANAGVARIPVPGFDCCVPISLLSLPASNLLVRINESPTSFLSTSGALLATAPADALRPSDVPNWDQSARMPDGGLLLAGATSDRTQLVIARLRPDGQVDASFGSTATGIARIRVDAFVSGTANNAVWLVPLLRVSADGRHGYLVAKVTRNGGHLVTYLLRANLQGAQVGSLDGVFGHSGAALLSNNEAFEVADVAEQADGNVVVATTADVALRLLGSAAPSPGFLGPSTAQGAEATEASGTLKLRVSRTLGADGVVSVAYRTQATGPGPYSAVADQDFTPVSGRLVWADGDTADKIVVIPLLRDNQVENTEGLQLELSDPQGGAALLGNDMFAQIIDSDTPPTPVTPLPVTPSPGASSPPAGGGGAMGGDFLLLLVAALLMKPRLAALRSRNGMRGLALLAVVFQCQVLRAAVGDMEPNYGVGGLSEQS